MYWLILFIPDKTLIVLWVRKYISKGNISVQKLFWRHNARLLGKEQYVFCWVYCSPNNAVRVCESIGIWTLFHFNVLSNQNVIHGQLFRITITKSIYSAVYERSISADDRNISCVKYLNVLYLKCYETQGRVKIFTYPKQTKLVPSVFVEILDN